MEWPAQEHILARELGLFGWMISNALVLNKVCSTVHLMDGVLMTVDMDKMLESAVSQWYGWLVEVMIMKAGLRYTTILSGVQSVMTIGMTTMPQSCVPN